jgi:hypothetical protein
MSQPRNIWNSRPMAYMLMPDEKRVMTAKEIALRPRVFSSKRRRRYSGTDRARLP